MVNGITVGNILDMIKFTLQLDVEMELVAVYGVLCKVKSGDLLYNHNQ